MWLKTQTGAIINLNFVERIFTYIDSDIKHENDPYIVVANTNGGLAEDIARFSTPAEAEQFKNEICRKVGAMRIVKNKLTNLYAEEKA